MKLLSVLLFLSYLPFHFSTDGFGCPAPLAPWNSPVGASNLWIRSTNGAEFTILSLISSESIEL